MYRMEEEYCWEDNRQLLTVSQHGIRGVKVLGHSVNNRAVLPLESHIHSGCMELVLLVKGNQSYTVDGRTYPLSGGDLFLTFPDEEHSTGSEPQNVSEIYWLQLDLAENMPFLELSRMAGEQLKSHLLGISQRVFWCEKSLRNWFADAFWAIASQDECRKEYGRSLLVSFLYGVIQQASSVHLVLSEEMASAVAYIRQNIREPISLETLSEYAGLSLSRFKARFKAEIGMSPREYINQVKIKEAKQLLKKGASVTDTALELGFNSSNYFAVVFKKMTLFSPTEYKEEIKRKNKAYRMTD